MRSACRRKPRRSCASSTTTAPVLIWGRAVPSPRPAPTRPDQPRSTTAPAPGSARIVRQQRAHDQECGLLAEGERWSNDAVLLDRTDPARTTKQCAGVRLAFFAEI